MDTGCTLTASDGHTLGFYRAEAGGSCKGGVVVAQEAFGVTPYIRSICDLYAGHGYTAIAPAFYDRIERHAVVGYEGEDRKRGLALRGRLEWDKVLLDVDAAIAAMPAGKRVGIVGFCVGGSIAWLAACRLGVHAASCYYPTDIAKQLDETPKCPVILHFGDADRFITPDHVAAVRATHPDVPAYVYHAGHGFNRNGANTAHRPEAAALALRRTLALFAGHVDGAPSTGL